LGAAAEFSLFLPAMELISSAEAEVLFERSGLLGSELCERLALEDATWVAALLVCSAPADARRPLAAGCG
jgi:hypothetical protein